MTYLEALEEVGASGSVMLVGHNPGIEEAFLMLAGHDAFNKACPYGFPTAGIAVLDYNADTSSLSSEHTGWVVTDFLAP